MPIFNPTSIIGTPGQVLANGNSGTSEFGSVTLTLPQSISVSSSPTFNGITLTSLNGFLYGNGPGLVSSLSTIPNSFLQNSTITVTSGAGLSVVGSPVALGGTLTLSNTGVISLAGSTGISVSSSTGNVTLTNTGVTSFSGGTTGLLPSSPTTGAVSLSGVLRIANGGTGLSTIPTNGQIDIGNGTGFTRTTITAGSGISIVNGAGSILISAGTSYSGVVPPTSGNTQIPVSNSSPTITQGTELWNCTVTPASVNSEFVVDFSAMIGVSNNNRGVTFALFRDSICIGATTSWTDSAKPQVNRIYVKDSPGTTSSIVYSLRAGNSTNGQLWHVGRADNFTFGGINQSLWTIKEIVQ